MKRLAATRRGSLRSTKVINALRKQGPHKEQPAMTYGAIDLHARYSQIRVLAADGAVFVETDGTRVEVRGWKGRRVVVGRQPQHADTR